MSDLVALRDEEKRLRHELKQVRTRIHELECLRTGVSVGVVVVSKGKEFRVTKVDHWCNPPWLYGVMKKKDGTWGAAPRCLYTDWVIVANIQKNKTWRNV